MLGFRIQCTISQSSESYGIFMQTLPRCYYFDLIGHIGLLKSLQVWAEALGFCRYNSINNMIGGVWLGCIYNSGGYFKYVGFAKSNFLCWHRNETKLYYLVRYAPHLNVGGGGGLFWESFLHVLGHDLQRKLQSAQIVLQFIVTKLVN